MGKKKIMVAFGTRPEAIKMAPLVHQLLEEPNQFDVLICVTGQHREMLDQVLKVFEITPDIDLNVMRQNQDLFDVTSSILLGMREVFAKYQPDIVLVHGDTTTTMATAIAAFYSGVQVGHVEAGLRDHSKERPEEKNRILTDNLSDLMFCPTPGAYKNLQKESKNINMGNFYFTGDVMRDIFIQSKDKFSCPEGVTEKNQDFCLFTLHRQENVDNKENLIQISKGINKLSKKLTVYFPMHPRTEKMCKKFNVEFNCVPLKPLNYFEFQWMIEHAKLVITDSGGVQKETFFHGKKSLLIYSGKSGWEELQNIQAIVLVEAKENSIVTKAHKILENNSIDISEIGNFFGDGNAANKIVQIACSEL